MAYIGREPLGGEVILLNSIESQFNGVLTTFNLTRTVSGVTSAFYPVGSQQLLVSLGGVIQRPDPTGDAGFRISFNTIIFAVAPPAGTSCFIVSYGNITDIGSPANNTVTTDKLVDGSVTPAKLSTGGPWWLSNGNAGIGTTNPLERLHVISATDNQGAIVENTTNRASITIKSASTSSSSYVNFGNSSGSSRAFIDFRESESRLSLFTSFVGGFINFYTDNQQERLRITSAGNVGIGITNPGAKLVVNGSGNLIRLGDGTNTFDVRFQGPNNWATQLDTTNDIFNISRNSVSLVTVRSDGNLGIGTTNPSERLDIWASSGSAGVRAYAPTGNAAFYEASGSNNTVRARLQSSGTDAWIGTITNHDFWISTNNSEKVRVLANGNVGIGTTNPSQRLVVQNGGISVSGAAAPNLNLNPTNGLSGNADISFNGTTFTLISNSSSADLVLGANTERVRITSTGNVGVGTTNPFDIFDIYKDQNASTILYLRNPNSGVSSRSRIIVSSDTGAGSMSIGMHSSNYSGAANQGWVWTSGASTPLVFGTIGTNRMIITTSGDVGIGTTNPGFKLEVNGSFAATTKSFLIKHPTKENYKLRHGSLEGPENGVYVRGRTSTNIIELPDYWTGLVDADSITVNLTPIGNRHIWVDSINNNKVYINSEDTIDCFYTVFAERKDVEKLIVEIEEN